MINMMRFMLAGIAMLAILHGNVGAAREPTLAERMRDPWTGDLDGIQERRYVRMLVCLSRTNYFFDGPSQRGLSYDGGMAFEKFLNERLGTAEKGRPAHISVVFIPVPRDKLIGDIIAGRGEIAAANLTITPERAARVDFSTPFLKDVHEVLVTHRGDKPIATIDDVAGMRLYVRKSSSYYASLEALNETFAKRKLKKVEIVAADEDLEDEDILEMVNAGVVNATVVDNHLAGLWGDVFTDIEVHPTIVLRDGGEIAWAVRKGSPQLRAIIDDFAKRNGKGTLTGNMAFNKYLKNNKWVKNAGAEGEVARYHAAADFFRKYGDQYDLPWLLVAAQAYQESGIDQSKRNPSGAVGVMQIKPSTASGAPILINGVDASAERNIEAGAKYLRFIVDQYYADEPMDRLNKGLFAVASYNAGPARIARLRKAAASMGLDPNKWFNNVEVAVAKDIGSETVQYVRNIYKYYLTYQLVVAQVEQKQQAKAATP
jgi:membrane-bound lytic murein transglycosylase MltF